MADIALEARGVSKFFPGVKALQGVSLTLAKGSIQALLGENGAGKSTLIKIITGVHHPDEGELRVEGEPVALFNPRHAMAMGIGVVHQERNLIPRFSVGENIMLEHLAGRLFKPIDYARVHARAKHWLDMLGLDVDPRMPVSRLSVAKMQLVEIAKALSLRSKVLLLDEPTASLTPHETVALFDLLKKLRADGVGILFVSHKLEEVQEICDAVTVLRDGRNACESRAMAGLGRQDLVRLMIGRTEQIPEWSQRNHAGSPPALELKGVATPLGHKNIDLMVRRGEIVGLYGLVGAGRTELAKSIMGLFPPTAGTVAVEGKPAAIRTVSDAIHRYRLGYVSEDRKNEGLVLIHSVLENAGIPIWRRLAKQAGGFLADRRIQAETEPSLRKLEVRTPSLSQLVGNLSGGNQQKISVAKWLAAGVKVLIVDEPSVGIDIKTKAYLHELIRGLADSGTAILLITSDMPEMITLADRIVVMNNFAIQGGFDNSRDYPAMSEAIMGLIHRATEAA
ncbi:sugar ABC transporter ATP-binding protein [Lichenifustis flavocetrariae]|uniref:Sugar ABC transporter ATP-binding protein n=1 Tax=Lichenifustis flavocetrariae TaxID=2949735 RepID=A0AA42CK21_9HYPH|nr:sugar ABC transporter ATP-binding protein [Lichenifustis flavocetrariae]MCW6508731.1 sugar ABC transporter ATP-binding protein [Lichenifustis flavocetrariae]